jgi:hypothetical protein
VELGLNNGFLLNSASQRVADSDVYNVSLNLLLSGVLFQRASSFPNMASAINGNELFPDGVVGLCAHISCVTDGALIEG